LSPIYKEIHFFLLAYLFFVSFLHVENLQKRISPQDPRPVERGRETEDLNPISRVGKNSSREDFASSHLPLPLKKLMAEKKVKNLLHTLPQASAPPLFDLRRRSPFPRLDLHTAHYTPRVRRPAAASTPLASSPSPP